MESSVIKYGKLLLTVKHPFLEHKKVEVLTNNEGTEYTCKFYDQSEIDGSSIVTKVETFDNIRNAFTNAEQFLDEEGRQKLDIAPIKPSKVTEEGLIKGMKH